MIKFGTGGFRGIIGDDFTKSAVQQIAQGLCDIIKSDNLKSPVAVGYDHRFGSEYFAAWIAETLTGNGIRTLLYSEPMPSPAVMTAVRDENLDYGIMITASHNPYRFNGVKLFTRGGMDADVAVTDRLEKSINAVKDVKTSNVNQAAEKGLLTFYSNAEQYIANVKSFIDSNVKNNNLNILYNNLYGVGAKCIAPLFSQIGVKNLTVLHTERDAFFGYGMPNPTEKVMEGMKRDVIKGKYDFAMATDSDVDRLGIIDEQGNYVSSNDILAALYYYLVKYRGMSGDVVKNCATSVLLDKLAAKLGFKCREVDVGFKNISAALKRYDALIGGESSGGLTVRGYIFGKDSVFSSALFTEMVAVMSKPVSAIIEEVRNFARYDFVFCEDEIRLESENGIVEFLENNAPEFKRKLVKWEHFNRNFKYYFDNDCWALIRLSGTEPVFRVFAEFESDDEARTNIEILRGRIQNIK